MLLKCYWCGHNCIEEELEDGKCPYCHKQIDVEYSAYRASVDIW